MDNNKYQNFLWSLIMTCFSIAALIGVGTMLFYIIKEIVS